MVLAALAFSFPLLFKSIAAYTRRETNRTLISPAEDLGIAFLSPFFHPYKGILVRQNNSVSIVLFWICWELYLDNLGLGKLVYHCTYIPDAT
jgi:hypothetical protein